MRRSSMVVTTALVGGLLFLGSVSTSGCSGSSGGFQNDNPNGQGGPDGSQGSGNDSGAVFGDVGVFGTLDGGTGGPPVDGGVACPSGLQCNVACTGGATTTVTGVVYDPAGNDPLYNVAVYVPAVALSPLPKGVPTGADACSCSALFPSGAVTNTQTAVDGSFKLTNVPVGAQVPLVLQIGKWRRLTHINVTACTNNAQADKSLTLPGTIPSGDTDDNMPDIAVSTGYADTLECLMKRIGVPDSEYVAGAGSTGHVHVFAGGMAGQNAMNPTAGMPESPGMSGAPPSYTSLWSTQAQLMPYDITLLSCEGDETYNANPAALEAYLNAGGRAFGSHYHYAWFSGPLGTTQSYSAPSDWGNNLGNWTVDQTPGNPLVEGPPFNIGGIIDTTLNGSSQPFPKGAALAQWLGIVGALGTGGVPSSELAIYSPRFNVTVSSTDKVSQPWITSDSTGISGDTMYFSFDTPVNAAVPSDGGSPNYCGRAVFSDLHVGGASAADNGDPPSGCGGGQLSAQEKALEFMLFDLSSCVIPDNVAPPDGGGVVVR